MCQSLCPPERPWHRAGAFPARPQRTGAAIWEPCRHFVDARGGRLLLRALPRVEPVAMSSSCLLFIPPFPLPGLRGHQGLQVPPRPAGAIKA